MHGTEDLAEVWLDGVELTQQFDSLPDVLLGSTRAKLALAAALEIFGRETRNPEFTKDLALRNYNNLLDQVVYWIPDDEEFDIVFWHNGNKWMYTSYA